MLLASYFDEHLASIRRFLHTPTETVRIIRHEPDSDRIIQRLLMALDDEEDNAACMIHVVTAMTGSETFFRDALSQVTSQSDACRSELHQAGIDLPQESKNLRPAKRFCQYICDLANSFPSNVAACVVVVSLTEISSANRYRQMVRYLAEKTESPWAKFIVFDRRENPMLSGLEGHTEIGLQEIHFGPEEIEQRVREDLESGNLTGKERIMFLAMTGSFAFSNKQYEEAEEIQHEVLTLSRDVGDGGQEANALYNLGNTCLAQNKLEDSEDFYVETVQVASANDNQPVAAMALTNLGVTLQRQGRHEESVQSFDAARQAFHALGHRPGEIHVLDCKAASFAAEKQFAAAEATWFEAVAVARSITAPQHERLRQSALQDLRAKLKRLYTSTTQLHKIPRLNTIDATVEPVATS